MKYLVAILMCGAVGYGAGITGGTHIQTYTIGIIVYFLSLISWQLGVLINDDAYM